MWDETTMSKFSSIKDCLLENLNLKDMDSDGIDAIQRILEDLDEEIAGNELDVGKKTSALNKELATKNTVDEFAKKLKVSAKLSLYNKAITTLKSSEMEQAFFSKKFKNGRRMLHESKALINGKLEGSFVSTSSRGELDSMRMYLEGLNSKDPEGYNKMVNYYSKGTDDGAMMKAIRIYSKTQDIERIKGFFKNDHDVNLAANIADGMLKVSEYQRGTLTELGAVLGKIDGYIGKQRIDRDAISGTDLKTFSDDIEKGLNLKKFLGRLEYSKYIAGDRKGFELRIKKVHDKFQTKKLDGSVDSGFGGKSRALLFNSAEDEADFMYKYGSDKTPMDTIMRESAEFGGNVAMWTWTGPKPKDVYGNIATKMSKALGDIAPTKSKAYVKDFTSYANRYIDAHVGMAGEPISDIVKAAQIAKLTQYFNLGSVIKTALPADLGQRVLTNLFQGQSFTKALSATKQAAQLLVKDSTKNGAAIGKGWKPLKSLGKSDQQLVFDRVVGSITQTIQMTMAQSMRMEHMNLDVDSGVIGKTHSKVSDAVSKFMEYTLIDPATKLQQNAVAIEKTPLYLRAIKGKDAFFLEDMNLTLKESEGLMAAGKLLDIDQMLNPELKAAGIEIFDADTLLDLDPEVFGGRRIQAATVQKLKSKLNAEMRTSVTQMTRGDNQPLGEGDISRVLGTLVTTFKPTIIKQTADNWHIINKSLDRFGMDGTSKRAAQYFLLAGMSAAMLDQVFSTLLDEKSVLEDAFIDGNFMDAIVKIHDKISAMPFVTDFFSAAYRANYRQGFGGIGNNIMGPVIQNVDSLNRAFKSNKKLEGSAAALSNMIGVTGMASSNILVKAAMRNMFHGDVKPDVRGGDFFKEIPKERRSKLRRAVLGK